jgi:protein TonB
MFYQKNIEISGTVKEPLQLAGLCSYLLTDEGSKIVVRSKDNCPEENSKITTHGILRKETNETAYYLEEISWEPYVEKVMPRNTPVEIPKVIDIDEVNDEKIELDLELVDDQLIDIEGFDENENTLNEDDDDVFVIVEKMPVFQGGDINSFRTWVQENLVYPDLAIENNISGRIIIQFTINKEGLVTNAKVLKGVDPLLDSEALRVVNSSPIWIPGQQRGRKVSVIITIPVTFNID